MILDVMTCNSIEIAFSWLDSNWDCSKEPWGMENNLQAFAASGRFGMTWDRGEVDDLGTAFFWTHLDTIKSEIITDPYLSNPLHNTCCLLYRFVVLPTGKSIPSNEIGILCFVETHGP